MAMLEITPLLVAILAFAAVAITVFVIGRYIDNEAIVQRRLPIPLSTSQNANPSGNVPSGFLPALAARIDEKKFGIEGMLRTKLRRELIRAGFFSDSNIRLYVIWRLGLVLILPTIVFILCQIFIAGLDFYLNLLLVAISAVIGIFGVDAYLSRRQRSMQQEYRIIFPDLIDMLVVCVDAGLALDAAFGRIRPEIAKESYALGANLAILSTETRAGRSMADALDGLSDRLNLDEARSFVIMLRQSLELGTDINDALRVFSDEMRGKRMLRAEENANKLPVKLVLPLGACIFPVILMVIMVPTIIKLMAAAKIAG